MGNNNIDRVSISLDKYNKLRDISNALKEGKILVEHDTVRSRESRYYTKDDLIEKLVEEKKELMTKVIELQSEIDNPKPKEGNVNFNDPALQDLTLWELITWFFSRKRKL